MENTEYMKKRQIKKAIRMLRLIINYGLIHLINSPNRLCLNLTK